MRAKNAALLAYPCTCSDSRTGHKRSTCISPSACSSALVSAGRVGNVRAVSTSSVVSVLSIVRF